MRDGFSRQRLIVSTTDNIDYNRLPPPEGYQPGCFIASFIVIAFSVLALLVVGLGDLISMIIPGSGGSFGPVNGTIKFLVIFFTAWGAWSVMRFRNPYREIGLVFEKMAIGKLAGGLIYGAVAGGLAFTVIAIGGSIGISDSPPELTALSNPGAFSWMSAAYMIFVYAAAEEVLFRGFLYPWMRRSSGMTTAAIITSLIFTMYHIGNPAFAATPLPLVNIFLASIFLTLLRDVTGDLWLASGAHFGWNFVMVGSGIPVSGIFVNIQPRNWYIVTGGPDWLTGGAFGPEGGIGATVAMIIAIVVVVNLIRVKNSKAANIQQQSY